MPPKVRVTKENIIKTATELVRQSGAGAINARAIASALGCSTQPIFSNFATMDELKVAVIQSVQELFDAYTSREIESRIYPEYKATGMAYIRFAKEEKELFKLLYMRDRSGESSPTDLEFEVGIEAIVRNNVGLNHDTARLFHLEMWTCVHGIATMFASGFLDLEWELVSKMCTDMYLGLKMQYGVE